MTTYSTTELLYFTPFMKKLLASRSFDCYAKLFFSAYWHKQDVIWRDIHSVLDKMPSHWTSIPVCADDCFEQWLYEAGLSFGNYLCVRELRENGGAAFHVLMADRAYGDEHAVNTWRSVSGCLGTATTPPERIGGLFGFLVMKRDCVLDVKCGDYEGRYFARDFVPWRDRGR
jgi:hypothetical protein